MKNKQVWLFNHYAQEPRGSGGTRHFSIAAHLKSYGWDMHVIAASVDHFSGRQRIRNNTAYKKEQVGGVGFIWLKTPEYRGNGLLRVLNMVIYTLRVYFGIWQKEVRNPDIIIGSSVHPFAAIAAALLAKKYKVPFIFEVRDLWPETLVAMGKWKSNSLKAKAFRKIETWLYHRANHIVTLLPFAHEYIASLGIDKDKVTWIPNGVEVQDFQVEQKESSGDTFTLMYLGSHGQANGLDCLLKAMVKIQSDNLLNKKVMLRMVGDGLCKLELLAQSRHLGLENVSFEEAVPKTNVPKLAMEADAFVICVRNLPRLYKYGISMNKIFDYMAAAKPILIASSARNNPVLEARCGLSVAAEDSDALAASIVKVVGMSMLERKELGDAGRVYVEQHFAYGKLTRQFSNILDDVA